MFKIHRLKERFEISAFLLILLIAANWRNSLAYNSSECAYLFMTPLTYTAHEGGELFEVAINVSLVEDLHRLELTLTYNASLLDVENVFQGSLFPSPPESIFKFKINESLGAVELNISLADSEAGISGNGTLAFVSFRVAHGQESCACSPLCLENSLLLDTRSAQITHDSVGALFFFKSTQPDPPVEGRLLDLYTKKGGVGPDRPDGIYDFGEMVTLVSYVTYSLYPVQQKLVGFEVRDAHNESVVFRTAVTDENGLAIVSFRIPVLVGMNGTWTVVSVVDIAEQTVWDTMVFWVNITLPVGGYSFAVREYAAEKPLVGYSLLVATLATVLVAIKPRTRRKDKRIPSDILAKNGDLERCFSDD